MLSVSNSLPVSNYSVKVVSEANGSIFNPQTNSRVRLTLPSSLGMVDMHSSFLQFKYRVVPPAISQEATPADRRDCYNMVMSNDQGVEQIIKNLRVSIDNKPVEEIQNYNVLHKFKKDYSEDNAQKSLDSIFDKSIQKDGTSSGYYCRTLTNATPLATYNEPQKHIIKLGCSGVLSLPVGLPILATGKVDIEFEPSMYHLLMEQHDMTLMVLEMLLIALLQLEIPSVFVVMLLVVMLLILDVWLLPLPLWVIVFVLLFQIAKQVVRITLP